MREVVITGCPKSLEPARATALLQSAAGLSPAEARRAIERVLRGEAVELTARSSADARLLVAALRKLGASAQVKADGGGG